MLIAIQYAIISNSFSSNPTKSIFPLFSPLNPSNSIYIINLIYFILFSKISNPFFHIYLFLSSNIIHINLMMMLTMSRYKAIIILIQTQITFFLCLYLVGAYYILITTKYIFHFLYSNQLINSFFSFLFGLIWFGSLWSRQDLHLNLLDISIHIPVLFLS